MENAFVLGFGFVGKATARALRIPYYFSKSEANITLEQASKKLFCIICLPTPTDEKGGQGPSVQVILDYIKQIIEYGNRNIFVIRSTVLPGTCRYLSEQVGGAMVVSNPEFLSESTADFDAAHPRIKVIGADAMPELKAVSELWKPIQCKLEIKCDTVTAEMIKYVFNVFAATKVVFANQIFDMCEKTGADYGKIHDVLHYHPWGSKHHFNIIDKGGRGAGGHCIPKDLKAFATYTNSDLFKIIERLNQEYLISSKKV